MRDRARVVIVGGGVGGASIAYHLADRGERDVLLIERAELTSGSTFHSAGLVGQLRSTLPVTRMMMHSVELYRRLEADAATTGRSPGWREVGSLRIASTPARMEELRRQHGWATTFGLPLELLGPTECKALFPPMVPDGVLGGVYLPTDGHLDPSGLTLALVGAARDQGVEVAQGVRVEGFAIARGRCTGVLTNHGPVETEAVVLACGMYTPQLALRAGVNVPIVPMAHQYVITEPIDGVSDALPQLRDPDNLIYFRREGAGLCLGGYERQPAPWAVEGVPDDFNGRLLPEDWDRFAPLMANACSRVPAVEGVGIRHLVNGPEGFTPDNEFILGETALRGLFVAAGFCAHGIAGAGGVGQVMAEWVLDGRPGLDVWRMDIRRFGPHYASRDLAVARAVEVYSTYYDIHYPAEERQSGRPLRRSPAYERLAALGCAFGEKSLWERPNWFEPNACLGEAEAVARLRPTGWAGEHWSPAIGVEALACRDSAVLFDETSFSKLEVRGRGASAFLERVCANAMDRPVGAVTYTQLCNERGGIECDLTATRLDGDRYFVVTGTAFGAHDLGWLQQQRDALVDAVDDVTDVELVDVTSMYTCYGLWGPAARAILQPLTRSPLGNEAFPYLTAQRLSIGSIPVVALRVTYVGELGWELYCPTEYGATLWDLLWDAGAAHGMLAGGYRAIDALRVEKGYRVWSSDITPDDTPLEAGLGFAVRLDKPVSFTGQAALRRQKVEGVRRRLCCLALVDPRAVVVGSEPVRVGEEVCGRVTSGGYGFRSERSLAFAYLPADATEPGRAVSVELLGERIQAEVVRDPVWDPPGERIRA